MNTLRSVWDRFWGLRWRWKASILVIFFLLLVAAIPVEDDADAPAQTPTASAVATQTVKPSPSPSATPKLSAPSPTPKATTPAPTATPNCPTLDQSVYFLALSEIQGGVATAFASMSESFIAAGEDPLLIFDDDWRLEVVVALAIMNVAAEQIRALDSPDGTEELHAIQLQIADELEIITSSAARGIDEIDAELLGESTTALLRTNTLVEESTAIIERYCE